MGPTSRHHRCVRGNGGVAGVAAGVSISIAATQNLNLQVRRSVRFLEGAVLAPRRWSIGTRGRTAVVNISTNGGCLQRTNTRRNSRGCHAITRLPVHWSSSRPATVARMPDVCMDPPNPMMESSW
jgi:hypothetical protein